jgi:hypothetical protein
MVKVKPGAKVITIVPAQDAYGNISIVKPGAKVITIEPFWNRILLSRKEFSSRLLSAPKTTSMN